MEYFRRVVMACNTAQKRLDLALADAIGRDDYGAIVLVSAKYDVLLRLIAGLQDGLHAQAIAEQARKN